MKKNIWNVLLLLIALFFLVWSIIRSDYNSDLEKIINMIAYLASMLSFMLFTDWGQKLMKNF